MSHVGHVGSHVKQRRLCLWCSCAARRRVERGVDVALHVGAGRADGRVVAARRTWGSALAASAGDEVPSHICAPPWCTMMCTVL
eukprot:6223325-Prymnesium_polylepis.1